MDALEHATLSAVAPSLTALLVYLRPAPRSQLLARLADLGVFIVEHQGADGASDLAASASADVAIVVGSEGADDVRLVQELARRPSHAVVVSLPVGSDPHRFLEAGALCCLTDEELETAPATSLAAAAHRARSLRLHPEPQASGFPLGGLSFDPAVPALSRNGRSRTLSRSERAVLLRLASSAGRPVELRELERAAAPDGSEVHPGFLKAVVLRIRRKIEDLGGDPELLRTVRGFGYVLGGSPWPAVRGQ